MIGRGAELLLRPPFLPLNPGVLQFCHLPLAAGLGGVIFTLLFQ